MWSTPAQALTLHRGLQLDVVAVQHRPALCIVLLPPHVHKGRRLALLCLCLRSRVRTRFLQMMSFATALYSSEIAWNSHLSLHSRAVAVQAVEWDNATQIAA